MVTQPPVDRPAARLRAGRDNLARLDAFEDGLGARVRARIPEAVLEMFARKNEMSWIDVEHDRHLASAIVEELGEERAVEYFRWLMTQMLDTPLLRASWTAAVRVFGLSPATLVRAVPVAWPAVFRNFGIPKVGVATAQSAKLELVQVPEDVLQVPAYLTAFGGLFAGLIDFCDARGECDAQLDVDQRRMGFTLRWQ